MFVDARRLPDNTLIEAEVCIIGGGAAGITLARQFIGQSFRVCLLESGGLRMHRATQRLYGGESVGLPYELDTTRTRFFGGSTNCWGGFCRPFEDFHFERRDWIPDSGWPISRDELQTYYDRAHAVCGLDPSRYDGETVLRSVKGEELRPIPASEQVRTSIAQLNKERRRFGHAFRDELDRAPNVTVCLNANAIELGTTANGAAIKGVCAATLAGNRLRVTACVFVLATGAIENARLLLASRSTEAAGLGNRHDCVGRYFMEHPTYAVTEIDLAHPADLAINAYVDRLAVLRFPAAAELNVAYPVQKAERLLDSAAHIEFVLSGEETAAATAAKRLYRDLWRGTLPPQPLRHLGAVLGAPLSVATFAWGLFGNAPQLVRSRRITISLEQCPNPDSRISLSPKRDALGMNRVRLDWRLTELDRYSLKRTAQILSDDLRRAGRISGARMVEDPEGDALRWNWHQMGTTRMHPDPKKGVVDAQCRVHGLANLFIAGSSVFPTAGNHTPTLTIIALALRLGDHIHEMINRPFPYRVQAGAPARPAWQAPDLAAARRLMP